MKGTLKILLWKHFVVRVRRYCNSPIEILSTVLLFIVLFAVKDSLLEKRINYQYELNVDKSAPILLDSVTGPKTIYYTPETELTRLLMSRIKGDLAYIIKDEHNITSNVLKYEYEKTLMLNIRDVMELRNMIKKPIIKSVASESYVMGGIDPIVVFQDVAGNWPKKLSYTIRMVGEYKTYSRRYINNEILTFYDRIHEPFLKLQWAIDSNYLELLTGAKITQRVNIQQFPYIWPSKDLSVRKISMFLKICCWLSLMLVSAFLSARLLDERVTGILELIKMAGVSNNVIALSHLINVVPAGIMYCFAGTLVVTVSSQPLISNTNPLLISIMLLLYYITIIALAFCISYMSDSASYSETMAVLMYLLLYFPAVLLEDRELPRWTLPLCGLLPHVPMHWFWDEVAALQQYGKDLTFADIASDHSAKSSSVLTCYLCLILQAFFFFGLAWYLARVRPGPHGQGMPWNFLFQRQYWGIKMKTPEGHEELLEFDDTRFNMDYFEAAPRDLKPGIKILNVSKNHGKELALAEVSFNVYKGEITVLLGHNGAGKTTLMSIIIGQLKPTEGKVLVEGLDTVTQKDKLQRIIGLCPQHNLFFPYLSVMEHVMFFTLLKGVSYEEAKKSSQDLLKQLGLADKSSCQTSQLSGGMKRRLQLACALAGDAKVLVLDEPTSGLDVETRRGLWDLLLSLRGSRTVLLSTHFMEEAEALGDRVAALHAGRLRCHATTMHLKRALGTGYRLSFTTIGLPDESAITAVITSKIPEATVNETSLNSISYNLPSKDSAKFPELFNFLKLKKSELGIDCIGIGASTLEDVFLKLCTEDAAELLNDIDNGNPEPVFKTVTGPRLYFRQLAVLFKRQLKYYWSKMSFFLIVKVIIPIMIIYGLTIMTCLTGRSSDPEALIISLNLDLYNKMADPKVLYSVNVSGVNLKTIENKYPKVDFELAPNVTAALLRAVDKNPLEYNKYLVGVQLNETDATVLFTTVERYTPPVALNLLTNMIATRLLPYADGQTVTTYNYPINRPEAYEFKVYKDFIHGSIWAVMVVFVTLTTVVSAVSLPCKERASGTRHIHVLSGCAPALHWAATLLTHALIYALVLVLPAVVICVAFERDHTIDRPDFLVAISVVLVLGIISFLALAYIVSFMFEERASSVVLVSITFFFVLVMPFVEVLRGYTVKRRRFNIYESIDYFLLVLSYGVPPHSLTNAAKRCVNIAGHKARHEEPQCYFCFEGEAPGGYMLAMAAQTIVFMAIVILAQYGAFNTMCDRILNLKYRTSPFTNSDDAVHVEREYVEKTITLPKNEIQDAMLVNDLHKKYWRIFYSPCNSVKGVSFSVKKGECFGLVGVNGAGKSSMFKMMTGIEVPTRGSLYANGHFKTGLSTNYLRSLAYCPQSSGLDGFLTGYESLELVLTLRGLEQSDVINEAKAVIKVIGLEKYANSVVSGYSGGCERQLAAAVALSGGAAVTLLDEPTAGVGVAARRRVWAALLRARRQRAVVVTSHSMDEMEALCGRIAIMVGGRVRALGGPAALRAAHTAGHAVALKLATFGTANIADSTDYSKMLVSLKETLKRRLHWTLRQEQKTMLHFYINYTMRYSELFSELEQLKSQFSIIEDYSVTETTLEEVFLTVTSKMYNDGPVPV